MKKIVLFTLGTIVASLLLVPQVVGQAGLISNIALGIGSNNYVKSLPGSTIQVCVNTGVLPLTCTTPVLTYSDPALSYSVTPVADANGNYSFYVNVGSTTNFVTMISAAGYNAYYQAQSAVPITIGSRFNPASPGPIGGTAPNTGAFTTVTIGGAPGGSYVKADGTGYGTPITSVGISVPSVLLTVSGSPLTTNGTITIGLANGAQNCIIAGPSSGGAGVLSCRALTSGDIPNNAANTSGTAANVSGTPALPNGTTATTQTTADSTAKIATDAFVVATAAALGALPANGCSTTAGGNLFCATGAFTTVTATTSVTSPLVNGTYSITSGGDACVKINTSLALIGTGNYGTVGIPPGTYTCSATVSYDPTYQSIIGAGPNAVHITARTGSTTFYMTEASYSISTVGELSGFTLTGDGSAGQIGVRTNGVIDPKIDRIVFSGFSGTSAVGLYTYNSLASNGWMERSHMRDLQFLGNTVGWQLACNTGNPSSCSFGYSDIDMQYTVGSGQVGINAVTGTLYHSKLRFTFNGTSGTTAFIQIGTAANWYGNEYSIVGEGTSGTGVTIASGGQMKGYPVLWDLGTASFVDGNAASMAGTSRIVPQAVGAGDFGSISNLGGGGNTGVANILSTYYPSNPYASISTLDGTNVHSLAFTAYNYSGNGWFYLACPFTMTGGLPSCTQVGYLDTSGDWKNQGTSYHVGNVGIGVAPYANPVRLAIGSTSDAINNQVQLNANSGQWVGAQLNINGWNNAWFLLNNSGSAVYGIPNSAVGINTSSGAALSLGANGAEAIHVTPAGVITANGNNLPTAEGTPTAGYATCWKTVGTNPTIGYCSSVVGATGTCTCN